MGIAIDVDRFLAVIKLERHSERGGPQTAGVERTAEKEHALAAASNRL
jgi:hypothetical protein